MEVATPDSAKTRKLICEEMERVARSREFSASERSCTFLRYLVERALDGSAHQLKERTIGVDVFGRDESDPRVVRHREVARVDRDVVEGADLPAGGQLHAGVPHLAARSGRNGAARGAGQSPITADFGAEAKVEVACCCLGGDWGSWGGLRSAGVVQPPTVEPGSAGAGDNRQRGFR